MHKVCPVCRLPSKNALLIKCDRCKVPFVNVASLRSTLSPNELKHVAKIVLRSWEFWIPFLIGLAILIWAAFQFVDYTADRKVHDVIEVMADDVNQSLKEAHKRMMDEIAHRFEDANIQRLMEQVVTQQAVERIDATADEVIEDKLRNEVAPRLEKIDESLTDADNALSQLQSLSRFYGLALRVRSDDRHAFESIMKILNDPSDPRFPQADAIVSNLPKEIDILNLLEYPVDWKELGIDPEIADIPAFERAMGQLLPIYQTKVMETAWKAQHLNKADRVQFLIDIMNNTPSLRCLEKACRLLNEESKVGVNFLAWSYPGLVDSFGLEISGRSFHLFS